MMQTSFATWERAGLLALVLITVVLAAGAGFAQEKGETPAKPPDADEAAELAKKLANPVASLISVPLQLNYDRKIGLEDDGEMFRLNVQPVIPFTLNKDWNLITRTIVPVIYQEDIPRDGDDDFGLGDTVASQFLSPKEPGPGGVTWGVGPAWLLPTATRDTLGGKRWGAGPTGVALTQLGPWTVGGLANHIWSFAGNEDRPDVNATFVQPFLAYVTKTKTTFSLNTEATYDWEGREWSVPLNLSVAQLFRIGKVPVQIGVGGRYWLHPTDYGPEGWGLRLQVTLLFPK
jgi:hypothetical protein